MDTVQQDHQLTNSEKKLYLLGGILFLVLLVLTIIFGSLFSPLKLLLLRLSILGTALIYYLAIYFYYAKFLTRRNEKIEEILHYPIIICINGKELGRL